MNEKEMNITLGLMTDDWFSMTNHQSSIIFHASMRSCEKIADFHWAHCVIQSLSPLQQILYFLVSRVSTQIHAEMYAKGKQAEQNPLP
jgi:hypothetical protein